MSRTPPPPLAIAAARFCAGADDAVPVVEGDVAGGARRERQAAQVLAQATAAPDGDAVRLVFRPAAGGPDPDGLDRLTDARPRCYAQWSLRALDLPEDWTGYARLELALAAEIGGDLALTLAGARSRLVATGSVAAGEDLVLAIDLADLPLIQGTEPSRRAELLRLQPARGSAGRVALRLHVLRLVPAVAPPGPVLDRYGQRLRGDWPGKVRNDADLRRARNAEGRELPTLEPPPERDAWGGWTAGPGLAGTGRFRIERDADDRWWFVDPAGRPFWSFGPTCVRLRDDTPVAGREGLFAELPPRDMDRAWPGEDRVSFHGANALRKYGSAVAWRDRVLARLPRWGANTLGNWSDPLVTDAGRLATTRELGSRVAGTEIGPRLCDVFDPAWERGLRARCRDEVVPHADDPWTVGWFVDNELPWGCPRLLAAGPDAPLRRVFVELARERFGDLAVFNAATACACADWEEVAALDEDGLGGGAAADALREDLLAAYAERYFAGVATALRAAAPEQLYLGCRFVRRRPSAAVVRAAGRHCDAVTVNCYALRPWREQFDEWWRLAGRPLLIGEHQFAAFDDPRLPPPTWPALTRDERRREFVAFVRAAAALPYCLGCHWFQHADQAGTGRSSNGENMAIGWVDIADVPHPEMVAAAREIGADIYAWHAASAHEPEP